MLGVKTNKGDTMNGAAITVTQLNKYVRSILEGDSNLKSVFVTGEISNFKINSYSGHIYLTLKDENAAVKSVMFKSSASRLKFLPEEGMKVICRGYVTMYERDGAYQLYINDMQPDGAGSIAIAFEQLKQKLGAEGLLSVENKKTLPKFPTKIAIITSETGAAVHDMINVLSRRWPIASLLMCPVSVQGEFAAPQMIEALRKVNSFTDCDLIIIGRGGGSAEDLWCFNDEALAREIFKSNIPVISAVGHETDFTICDFVADMRAPTPSAAAEIAVPEISEVYSYFTAFDLKAEACVLGVYKDLSLRLDNMLERPIFSKKAGLIEPLEQKYKLLKERFGSQYERFFLKHENSLVGLVSKLSALNPAATLERGFSITSKNKKIVKSITQISVGDSVDIKLNDGSLKCIVNDVNT